MENVAGERMAPWCQAVCRAMDSSNALTPFQPICTPMQTRRNDDSFTMTNIALVGKSIAQKNAERDQHETDERSKNRQRIEGVTVRRVRA
jgi:hypothetical protein